MDTTTIIEIVIQAVILFAVGYFITQRLASVDNKLVEVLEGQKHIEINIAKVMKDVDSNKEWGRDSKTKIEILERKVNDLEKDNERVKATLLGINR